tara:strand:- start:310 stop:675 length:366 start_codon:yes stop_codon:yes gene_type:complete
MPKKSNELRGLEKKVKETENSLSELKDSIKKNKVKRESFIKKALKCTRKSSRCRSSNSSIKLSSETQKVVDALPTKTRKERNMKIHIVHGLKETRRIHKRALNSVNNIANDVAKMRKDLKI